MRPLCLVFGIVPAGQLFVFCSPSLTWVIFLRPGAMPGSVLIGMPRTWPEEMPHECLVNERVHEEILSFNAHN